MTKSFKVAVSVVALVSAATIAAYAADPTPAQTQSPQVAVTPDRPNADAGKPGGGNGHWVWMPSNPSPAAASAATGARSDDGDYYSKKGFGPKPQ